MRTRELQCKRCGTSNDKSVLKKYPRGDYVCQSCGFYSPYYAKFSIFRKPNQERKLKKFLCRDCGATYNLTEQEWLDDQFWHCDSCDAKGTTLKVLTHSSEKSNVNVEGVQLVRQTDQSEDQVVLGSAAFGTTNTLGGLGLQSEMQSKSMGPDGKSNRFSDSVSDANVLLSSADAKEATIV